MAKIAINIPKGLERFIVALLLIGTGVVVPAPFIFPASIIGCLIVMFVYRAKFARIVLSFIGVWICFYLAVGWARYFSGANIYIVFLDGTIGVSLALVVSCSLLTVLAEHPSELLITMDWLKIPRILSYAFLALLRLMPQINTIGSRQIALLKIKGVSGGSVINRFTAYRRIMTPLFNLLLTQQWTHARSLESRGFFDRQLERPSVDSINTFRGSIVCALLMSNVFIWYGVSLWYS